MDAASAACATAAVTALTIVTLVVLFRVPITLIIQQSTDTVLVWGDKKVVL